jgi:D-alanyl-D-alanine carboxypeptidase (penicillin-binding protein 5/6)
MPARLLAAVSVACLSLTFGTASAAAGSGGSALPVGGPLLAGKGVIERPLHGAPALPSPKSLPAKAWLVSDLTTGQVLAAKDPHGTFLPASTLKMLTAITLIPRLRPSAMEPVSDHAADVDGSRVGLVPGLRYSVRKLFTCMLVVSANDAADALAQANGGIPRTVGEMNAKARELQADDTVAKTPSGLDAPGEQTSAYDLALIAQAGLKIPAFRHYIATVHSTVPAPHHKHFAIYSHNYLLTTYRGDIGVKNGYTVNADGTYVGAATRHGQTILITLMHAYPNFWPMARSLLNWGFAAQGKVAPIGTLVQPLPPASTAVVPAIGAAHHLSAGAVPTSSHSRLPWLALEITTALAVGLTAALAVRRRQERRRRRYRPRLRLPPTR